MVPFTTEDIMPEDMSKSSNPPAVLLGIINKIHSHFLRDDFTFVNYMRSQNFDVVINSLHPSETILAGAVPDVPTMTHISMAPSIIASISMNIPLIASSGYMLVGP